MSIANDSCGGCCNADQGGLEGQIEVQVLPPPIAKLSQNASQALRGGIRGYSPCVLDRTEWHHFYQTRPVDYDIRNDPVFNCHRSTYSRLMNIDHPVPEPTTSEMLRTGQCGPDHTSYTRPAFLRDREHDHRPEPAYRLKLADRTALHYMRADPLEGVLPFGRTGDLDMAKSVTHRDYKWRICCKANPPRHATMERKVYRYPKTDLHGRQDWNEVVKFEDDYPERYMKQKLIKLKKAWFWPINTITRESLGGRLEYPQNDPCMEDRERIWPCGEKNILECEPIQIPTERCAILAHTCKEKPRQRERHFHQHSYLDMRYPSRNYECWEEVPNCCEKPSDFPAECCFKPGCAEIPNAVPVMCPPKPKCAELPPNVYCCSTSK